MAMQRPFLFIRLYSAVHGFLRELSPRTHLSPRMSAVVYSTQAPTLGNTLGAMFLGLVVSSMCVARRIYFAGGYVDGRWCAFAACSA